MEKSKFSRYVIDESKQHKSSLAIQIVYSNQVFKYVFSTNDNFRFKSISLENLILSSTLQCRVWENLLLSRYFLLFRKHLGVKAFESVQK